MVIEKLMKIQLSNVNTFTKTIRVLHLQEPGKYMLIYYCGRIPTGGGDYWHYEGGILYSKTTELAQDEKEKINQAASAAGINLSKWCPVSQSLCIY